MERPVRIVAFGGGTGLPVLLAGLRDRHDVGVTAVVTVGDDGGSSGRLRRRLGVPPPGDIRGCLAALAPGRRVAAGFDHRFTRPPSLRGHALGNLVLAALAATSRDFPTAVRRAAAALRVRGAVLPAAVEGLTLVFRAEDGSVLHGESRAGAIEGPIARLEAAPPGAPAPFAVAAAIDAADVVVLGPGSLYTSTIAALLGEGTRPALGRFPGPVVYLANLLAQPGETIGLTAAGHVDAIERQGGPRVTDVLLPLEPVVPVGGQVAVRLDAAALADRGVRVHRAPLLRPGDDGQGPHHDPDRLAAAVVAVGRALGDIPDGAAAAGRAPSWS